jgi:hypothetical protein
MFFLGFSSLNVFYLFSQCKLELTVEGILEVWYKPRYFEVYWLVGYGVEDVMQGVGLMC